MRERWTCDPLSHGRGQGFHFLHRLKGKAMPRVLPLPSCSLVFVSVDSVPVLQPRGTAQVTVPPWVCAAGKEGWRRSGQLCADEGVRGDRVRESVCHLVVVVAVDGGGGGYTRLLFPFLFSFLYH